MQVVRREVINATPENVWSALVDVEAWPAAMKHIRSISRLDRGPFDVGSAAVLRQPGLPATRWTVDEMVIGERFRWWGRPLGMTWTADHIVEAAAGGTTSLTLSVEATGLLSALLAPVVRRAAARALALEFAGFRTACE